MLARPHARAPRWYAIPGRVLLVTFLGTLISFAVALLFGIIGTVVVSALRGVHPNMTIAYRHIALPAAIAAGAAIFVLSLAMEIHHHRQSKALANIERVS